MIWNLLRVLSGTILLSEEFLAYLFWFFGCFVYVRRRVLLLRVVECNSGLVDAFKSVLSNIDTAC